ncbi:MAG: co-chaperone DjlA [Candidatus Berkiellales bacterium]
MTYIYGKIAGAILGGLIAGPMGFMLGIIVGHLFDKGLALNERLLVPDVALARKVFFKTTFMIMGYIAKADGRVSEREIQMARSVMEQLHLTPDQKMSAIQYFNQGKSPQFNWGETMDVFVKFCGYHPQLIQMFVEIQLKAAFVDGLENHYKRHVLEMVCDKLNVPLSVLSQMESQYRAERVFREPQRTPQDELSSAYALLGISDKVSDQQVKKAYRQLMSQHHPDKLVSKGLPEEMIRMATEKTQKIQKSYEVICKARGIK